MHSTRTTWRSRRPHTPAIRPEWTRDDRAEALLAAVAYSVDCHEWSLSWHPRGLMLTHKGHRFVLGVPANFREFLEGNASDTE